MAGGSSRSATATPSATPSSSSRTTRSAAKAGAAEGSNAATPTRKQKQKSLAAIARNSAAGKHALKNSSVPPSPLHPSLPRPPSWQSSLAASLDKSPRRKSRKRTSVDERDPGDSVNSTEDEDERDDDDDDVVDGQLDANETMLTNKSITVNNKHQKNGSSSSDEKQNICVCVRIRPGAAAEEEAPIWEVDEQAGRITLSENHPIMEKRKNVSEDAYDFTFDALLLPPHPTSTMYESRISQVVLAALEGYNGTIFSYGQTGSGKTHTMTGSDEEPGILPLAISDIFQRISNDTEREYLLRVSYLEIYNETLKDLLAPVKQKSLELRLTEDNRGRIVVNNIKEEIVNSPQDVLRVLTKGEDNRSVNCTDWNQRSSRSHCVFSMIIESRPRTADVDDDAFKTSPTVATDSIPKKTAGRGEVRISQLNLIDLAGSERATSQEERRKEGAFINKSLLSLSNVIHKLADEKTNGAHIPYRDSKLTRLLQTSLSGNARIAIVCTISPEARHGTESVSTLKFAQRASKVVTKAECGVVTDGSGALLANLQETIANLQAQLAKSEAQGALAVDDGALQSEKEARQKAEEEAREQRMKVIQLTDQIAHLQRQILTGTAQSNDEVPHMPRTPSITTRHYGDLGTGSRPAGQRGSHRRLSELAFGLASPARPSGLPASSSMRSISSALETIHSPDLPSGDERIGRLEEQLASVKTAAQQQEQDLRSRLEESEARNENISCQLTATLNHSSVLEERAKRLELKIEEKEMTVNILREELAAHHESEKRTEDEQQKKLASLRTEVLDLQKALRERDERIRVAQENQLLSSTEMADAVKSLQEDLRETRERLLDSEARNASTRETMELSKNAEISLRAEVAALCQKADLAEAQLAERDACIATLERRIAKLDGALKDSKQESDAHLSKCSMETTLLKEQIQKMKQNHALEAAELNAEYRQEVAQLQDALQKAETEIEQQRALASAHEQTISALRAELEKKEQARVRLAQLKAANTPPDFGALQAKMQAVSGRSANKGLNNSLGSSTGSQSGPAASEGEVAVISSLKAELKVSKSQLASATEVISTKDQSIKQLEQRVLDLESSIATYRRQIDKNQALLDELDNSDALVQKLQTLSVRNETPEPTTVSSSSRAHRPLGVVSPHRGNAPTFGQSRVTGPSTPTKKDGHGYTLHAKPPPLPLPPGTPEWRKQRRETREHEMSLLRSGGIASRTRTYLQSPKLESNNMDWGSRGHVDHHGPANLPIRSQKSSGGSVRSQY